MKTGSVDRMSPRRSLKAPIVLVFLLAAACSSNDNPIPGDAGGDSARIDVGLDVGSGIDLGSGIDVGTSIDVGSGIDAHADIGGQDVGAGTDLASGTKTVGQHCSDKSECKAGLECVKGQYTSQHCDALCKNSQDCNTAAPGSVGNCIPAAGLGNICMYLCGVLANGAPCPGDLVCVANAVCR